MHPWLPALWGMRLGSQLAPGWQNLRGPWDALGAMCLWAVTEGWPGLATEAPEWVR